MPNRERRICILEPCVWKMNVSAGEFESNAECCNGYQIYESEVWICVGQCSVNIGEVDAMPVNG